MRQRASLSNRTQPMPISASKFRHSSQRVFLHLRAVARAVSIGDTTRRPLLVVHSHIDSILVSIERGSTLLILLRVTFKPLISIPTLLSKKRCLF